MQRGELARSGGLKAAGALRARRWVRAQACSQKGSWVHLLTNAPIGKHIAPYMAHAHQNRGNIWLRQKGWVTLFPAPDPAPWRGAAVAASGGFAATQGMGSDGLRKPAWR